MKIMAPLALSLALSLPAAPALAESLHDTHVTVWRTGGKTPATIHRPITRNDCRVAQRIHLAGKTPLAANVVPAGCTTKFAAAATNANRD